MTQITRAAACAPTAVASVATLAADGGSPPASGSCEPATGTLEVTGSRDRTLHLEALGEVCGEFPDANYVAPSASVTLDPRRQQGSARHWAAGFSHEVSLSAAKRPCLISNPLGAITSGEAKPPHGQP